MRKHVYTRWTNDPKQLTKILAPRLQRDEAHVWQLIRSGCVYVNDARAAADVALNVGDKITVFDQPLQSLPPFHIVHDDPWLVVVDKPPGLPSQAERSQGARALDAQVRQQLGEQARLIHRLDKEASGLVLFANKPDACAPLQSALAAGEIERRYVAIVDGELLGESSIRLRIGRHAKDARLRAALPEHAPAGETAYTSYRALAHAVWRHRPVTAVDLRLQTGRTHQLRVHLAAISHPIVGDSAYGGQPFDRLCLHGYILELPHPRDRSPLRLHAPLPPVFAELVPGLTSPFT